MPSISFASLPALGQPLEGGTFHGITTEPDGTHYAVALLPEQGSNLTYAKAKAWAKKLGGTLPTGPVAALLFANAKHLLRPHWHWCLETKGASFAWHCLFSDGGQDGNRESYEGSAVAVRLIPLTA